MLHVQRVQECVSRLEAQATDYKFEQGRLLREEKVRMSRSCRQIETDKKPKWHNNMHRADCFQTQFFMPYKFMPKYKQEQLLFPERVLEKGNKRCTTPIERSLHQNGGFVGGCLPPAGNGGSQKCARTR